MRKNLESSSIGKSISIFARPHFFGPYSETGWGLFLHRGASLIRGEQIAQYLGAKYNPTKPSAANYSLSYKIRKKLSKIGVKFITCFYFKNRQDVSDFYKKIDLQVIGVFGLNDYNPFRHPNKIINAASFGIPTVANWMLGYKEFEDNYVPVQSMESLLVEVEKMKNKNYYDKFASKIIKAAEPYHISKIAEMYRQLT